jgi:eukaryotic-like serine/threonine-protein kinase
MVSDLREKLQDGLGGRYRVERELGRGGMATVYLAHDLRHDRPVALKVLNPDLAVSLGVDRFLREIHTAARLQHPHILTVHDSGETAGHLWFTMPYVEGESLRDRLAREVRLSLDTAIQITREAAQALQCAHDHGVIHRDIKPENLLLTKDGSTLVADFGIARALTPGTERLTDTGLAVGTPAYMSPEQASGDQVDARTDVYSLATVLYEMLAGESPYPGRTPHAIPAFAAYSLEYLRTWIKRFNVRWPSLRQIGLRQPPSSGAPSS